jgi:hypothetical protein
MGPGGAAEEGETEIREVVGGVLDVYEAWWHFFTKK